MKQHGKFKIEGNQIIGPGDYMNERFPQFEREVQEGINTALKSVVIANVYTNITQDEDMVYLRAIQLDYANWHGVDSIMKSLKK